jgi:hypothetical protein
VAGVGGPRGERQGTAHGAERAVERELADDREWREDRRVDQAGGGEDAERDRQIERRPRLGQIRRREADDRPPRRRCETAARERGRDSFARLLHRPGAEPDEGGLG